MRRTAVLATALLVAVAGAACGGDDGPPAVRDTTSTSTTDAAWQSCDAPRAGYALDYPPNWHTNPGDVVERCHWFDARTITLAPATDVFGVPVYVRVVEGGHEAKARQAVTSGGARVLLQEQRRVAGRDAVVVEVASTGVVGPAGSRTYTWFVAAGARTLVASASEMGVAGANRYDEVKGILDRMVASLRFTPVAPRCSGDGLSATPTPQPQLPDPVATTRRSLVDAATQCDYAALAALAAGGRRPFTASFGGAEDVAAYWQRAEAAGEQPLRFLVGLLDSPHARRPVQGDTQFLWPAAYAAERWTDVGPEQREALRPLYGDDDFARFERFGSYAGYRIGIAGDGEWLFFVAGD